jgi:hypothetical protein
MQMPAGFGLALVLPQRAEHALKCAALRTRRIMPHPYLAKPVEFPNDAAGQWKTADQVTLKDLLVDPEKQKLFKNTWAVVGPNATLKDARRAMTAKSQRCNDVFATENGREDTPILGWLTDNRLGKK